jgi:hypothetical protein
MSRKVVLSDKKSSGGSAGGTGRQSSGHDRSDRGARDHGASEDGPGSSSSRRTGRRVDYDEKEAIEITTDADVEVYSTFDEMGLKEDLLRGVYAYGNSFVGTR